MVNHVGGNEVQLGLQIAHSLNEVTPVEVAFWNYEPAHGRWTLVFGVPDADKKGPRFVWYEIQKILSDKTLTLDDFRVVSGKNDIASAIKKYFLGMREGSYPRIDGVAIGDFYIEHAVVIWTKRPLNAQDQLRKLQAHRVREAKSEYTD